MASVPTEPSVVATSVEAVAKPPWRPRVSGIGGFLCGPLAGAIIAFINLRRLNENRKANWTLALTILACLIFGVVIAEATDTFATVIGKVIGNVVSPFLFPLLQKKAFDEWAKNHPLAESSNGWRASGWAILGLVVYFVIAVGAALGVSSKDVSKNIKVRYGLPANVNAGDPVEITIEVANEANRPQLLYSLDFDTHFLKGISVEHSSPAFESTKPNMLAPILSYVFEQDIPANGKIDVVFHGRALSAGTYPLSLDACVKTAMACENYKLGTIVVH
ncbi:MAG: hypothetical protein WA823_15490 [Candidatus Acidiferrales bacterium]